MGYRRILERLKKRMKKNRLFKGGKEKIKKEVIKVERRLCIIVVVVLVVVFGMCLYICREAKSTREELRDTSAGAESIQHRLTKKIEEREAKKIKQGEKKNVEK